GSNSTAPVGTMQLAGGKLTVPAGSADYYVNQLSVSNGGSIDLTGASSFWLHMTGSGSRIDVAGNSTWTGPGTTRLQNDTSAMIDLALTSGTTLTNSIPLTAGSGQGFHIVDPLGSGATLVQTGTGSNAPITMDRAFYQFADPGFVTIGALTLQNGSRLSYTGTTPGTLNRNITLAAGTFYNIEFLNASIGGLTMSGIISEASPGQELDISSGIVTLPGSNTYTG